MVEMACFVSVNSNCESLTGLCDFLPITRTLLLIKLPTSYVKLVLSLYIIHHLLIKIQSPHSKERKKERKKLFR